MTLQRFPFLITESYFTPNFTAKIYSRKRLEDLSCGTKNVTYDMNVLFVD